MDIVKTIEFLQTASPILSKSIITIAAISLLIYIFVSTNFYDILDKIRSRKIKIANELNGSKLAQSDDLSYAISDHVERQLFDTFTGVHGTTSNSRKWIVCIHKTINESISIRIIGKCLPYIDTTDPIRLKRRKLGFTEKLNNTVHVMLSILAMLFAIFFMIIIPVISQDKEKIILIMLALLSILMGFMAANLCIPSTMIKNIISSYNQKSQNISIPNE